MTAEGYQAIIFILSIILIVWLAIDIFNWSLKRKSKGVPDLRSIPPLPIQRYTRTPPTIETQYGRDLLRVSTEIFIKNLDAKMNPEDRAQCSVLSAVNLLSEVGEVCHEKDNQKHEETQKRSRELFKEMEKEKREETQMQINKIKCADYEFYFQKCTDCHGINEGLECFKKITGGKQ